MTQNHIWNNTVHECLALRQNCVSLAVSQTQNENGEPNW